MSLSLHSLKKLLVVSAIGLLSSHAFAQDASKANKVKSKKTAPVVAEKTVQAPVKGLLFEVKSKNHTAYLYGSIHLGKQDFFPVAKPVEAAYKAADILAVEVDATDPAAMQVHIPKLSYAAGDKLENHLKPETWAALTGMVGPAAQQFQPYKPMMVAMGLVMGVYQQMGYDQNYGIDKHFIDRAKADKKQIVELETIEFQIDTLNSLNDDEADAMLKSTLDSFKTKEIMTQSKRLVEAWEKADTKGVIDLINEGNNKDEGTRKFTKILLDDRNIGMSEKITTMMNEGKKVFIVVGAGHLAGEKSIIDLLEKQGMKVKQIK
jgi:uncharacterized protein YbaP (TraB family)